MLINGIELSTLGVELYDRVIKSNGIYTTQEWLDGDLQPTFIRQQDKFKYIELQFLVLGNDENDAFLRISHLTQALKKASLVFDDIDLTFDTTLVKTQEPERLKNGNFIVTYLLTGDYAKGKKEIYTTDANATNSFKLNILYYKDSTSLIRAEAVTLRAGQFKPDGTTTLNDLNIDVNKYQPEYYNSGVATNLGALEFTFDNFKALGTLIVNYEPVRYNITVNYFMDNGAGVFEEIIRVRQSFTKERLDSCRSIGELIDISTYRPEGYKGTIDYTGALELDSILAHGTFQVFYRKIENEITKNIVLYFYKENDNGELEKFENTFINVKESDIYDGKLLKDVINIDSRRPNEQYYDTGYITDHSLDELAVFENLETEYRINYKLTVNNVFLEYYAGIYPNWSRISTITMPTKYRTLYDTNFTLDKVGLDLQRYKTSEYEPGVVVNENLYTTYEEFLNAGVIQIYYTPIDYPIRVTFYKKDSEDSPVSVDLTINATQFFNNPTLTEILPINENRPENYQLDVLSSYRGEVTLAALTQASPIVIVFEEIQANRTKNVILRYRKELASAFGTINTSLITVNEADCIGGVRLKDLFNLDAYKPDYYESGVIDGSSSTAVFEFDQIASEYNILYIASFYNTPVRYYTDQVADINWIASSNLSYRVFDFSVETTLFDLGLDLNAYKPYYCDSGELQYNGPVNFEALRQLTSIDIIYKTVETPPGEDEGIDYPHRVLFLQHNDLGEYESLHPNWTMNHAYINTGVTADDMSKLTVIMECRRVDEDVPLSDVNVGRAYLFGSTEGQNSFCMGFDNQTKYGTGLTGVNLYFAKAGRYTNELAVTEEAAVGFSANSGIYASARDGYSYATFTYTNSLQTETSRMNYPIYLFANNNAGSYQGGLGGIGITGCRIYYDNQLIRDYIPVQFYDKIGDQVAPSNCLYDKVSKTFFEDETGMKSFNIMDDENYEDTNLEHRIGHCYVNYFKGTEQFQSIMVMFRASDFTDGEWDPYEKFSVDQYQPSFYKPGLIQNYNDLIFDFENVNNSIYNVVYEQDATSFQVNYWKVDGDNRVLIATDTIPINEQSFYQVPSFGDLARLNKYKPEGYKTNFVYPDNKVTLARVLTHAPYDIEYIEETDPIETYTTTIKYIKKVYGLRTYQQVGTQQLTFDQTDFRDGEYIDFYIDKDLYKPERFYVSGENYQWYEMDERLDSPDNLRDEYIIVYNPSVEPIQIEYYVDSIEDENLIATTNWNVKIDEFVDNDTFYVVDLIPNHYINDYKPGYCRGGILQNPSKEYTFAELADTTLQVVYPRLTDPHDPEGADYLPKVLVFGELNNKSYHERKTSQGLGYNSFSGKIPYIDLGYTPKELSRLRVEITCFAGTTGTSNNNDTNYISNYSSDNILNDYKKDNTYFFGYYGSSHQMEEGQNGRARNPLSLASVQLGLESPSQVGFTTKYSYESSDSYGAFGLRARVPGVSGWVYTSKTPYLYDGMDYGRYAADIIKPGVVCVYRKGKEWETDDDYNFLRCHATHQFASYWETMLPGKQYSDLQTEGYMHTRYNENSNLCLANPWNIIFDAYNGYTSISSFLDSNSPTVWNWKDRMDGEIDIWEHIERPKGSITVFQTRNPYTGEVNINPFCSDGSVAPGGSMSFPSKIVNAYIMYDQDSEEFKKATTKEVWIDTGRLDENGQKILEKGYETVNLLYLEYQFPVFPQLGHVLIWGIKLYDRGKLVRNLIPVGKGDRIYDYVMPDDGLFDLQTEIFFGNKNFGGHYTGYENNGPYTPEEYTEITIDPSDVFPLTAYEDLLSYGKIQANYYDYDNEFIDSQYIDVPTYFSTKNTTLEDILQFNDFKPDDFHLDGFLDLDDDLSYKNMSLAEIYELNTANIYYKLRTFTKTVLYYQDNLRVGSRDLFYSILDIQQARTLADLGVDVDLYYNDNFKHGKLIFNESIIAEDDIKAFIDAPSPVVVYEKLSKEEAPNLLYVEYYRGGAYDDSLITIDPDNENYLNCNLNGVVLNPNGAIKYDNHYHSALYEDEEFDYFIPYQVKVTNKYAGIHNGPARKYQTLAMVISEDYLTIVQERNGWGKLKEYKNGWVLLNQFEPVSGPGQNPDYDVHDQYTSIVPFGERIHITKMTIDRLWCYDIDSESWIKAEDLSYDQSGKLYSALKMEVIDLSTLDFTNINSLEDMGIYKNAWKLRFHDNTTFEYTGDYTLEAFQDLHEIDIVYPETIYHYNCIYYQDNINDQNELGRVAFSCSISDWNPDWDKFLETSWQTESYYEGVSSNFGNNNVFYYYAKTNSGFVDIGSSSAPLSNIPFYDYESKDIYDNYYKISGKRASIFGREYVWIQSPKSYAQDAIEVTIPVEPTLYRGTELTLNWNYFGCERDKFKPAGYYSGIYNWNPHIWDEDNEFFSFKDLVTIGTIKVIYPSFNINAYKIDPGPFSYKGPSSYPYHDIPRTTHGISLNYLRGTGLQYTELYTDNNIGLYYSGQRITPHGAFDLSKTPRNAVYSFATVNNPDGCKRIIGMKALDSAEDYTYYGQSYYDRKNRDHSWKEIDSTTDIAGLDDIYSTQAFRYYSPESEEHHLRNHPYDRLTDWMGAAKGYYYNVITYSNGEIIHYWVPAPKGMWYKRNGKNLQIPENCFFDLMTGTYDVPVSYVQDQVKIRPRNQDMSQQYNYFNGWEYDTIEKDYIVSIDDDISTYQHPDIYSDKVHDLFTGLILPISEYTSDSAHKVQGEWYKSCNQWFKSYQSRIYAGQYFNANKLTKRYETISIVSNGIANAVYLAPSIDYNTYVYTGTVAPSSFDFTTIDWKDGYYLDNSGEEAKNSGFHCSNYIAVTPTGGRLTLGLTLSETLDGKANNTRLVYYDSYKNYIGQSIQSIKEQGTYTISAILTSSVAYIRLSINKLADFDSWTVTEETHREPITTHSYGSGDMEIQSYYYYEDEDNKYFFDGNFWIPFECTSANVQEHNKNYAITRLVPYYSLPIEDDEYKAGLYQYGDRVTVLYISNRNRNWGYTGQGWIKLANNTDIIE